MIVSKVIKIGLASSTDWTENQT